MEKAREKVDRERAKLAAMESKRNAIEERLNSTKPLDNLNEEESRLERLNEEYQAIIQDKHDASLDIEAAQEPRNEELARLRTHIQEREAALPFRERIKEIFKKMASL